MATVIALFIMTISPMQIESLRQKRWTFNSWRLHGGRHTPSTSLVNPYTGLFLL